MRDKNKTIEYFNYAIDGVERSIARHKNDISVRNPNIPYWSRVYDLLANETLQYFKYQYSIGASKEQLYDTAQDAIIYYCKAENLNDDDQYPRKDKFSDYIGVFEHGLDLVSLLIIFQLDHLKESLMNTFSSTKGNDGIMDMYISILDGNPLKIVPKSPYKKQYGSFLELLQDKKINELSIKTYLESWYKTKRSCTWYGRHKHCNVGGGTDYAGYWSLEALALCKLNKMDKESLKDTNYLPLDLI